MLSSFSHLAEIWFRPAGAVHSQKIIKRQEEIWRIEDACPNDTNIFDSNSMPFILMGRCRPIYLSQELLANLSVFSDRWSNKFQSLPPCSLCCRVWYCTWYQNGLRVHLDLLCVMIGVSNRIYESIGIAKYPVLRIVSPEAIKPVLIRSWYQSWRFGY